MKIAKISVHFYNAVDHLVDIDTPVLRNSNKNVLKKLEYFDVLDEVSNIYIIEINFLGEKRSFFLGIIGDDSFKY